jgi:hypothetical protein
MIEIHRKNLEAIAQTVAAVAESPTAQNQREIVDAGLRKASTLAPELKAQRSEPCMVHGVRQKGVLILCDPSQETAQLTRVSTGGVVNTLQDKMRGLEESGQGQRQAMMTTARDERLQFAAADQASRA